MTLAQIILRAIHLLDEEPGDVDEFHDLFMAFANEGYRIAVTQYVRPRQRFPVKTDKGGFAPLLFAHVTRVVRLEDEMGCEVFFDLCEDGLRIKTRRPRENMVALCEIAYPDLERDDDVPRIPDFLHPALADYICYRYLASGNLARQSRAQVFSANFYRAMQAARPQGMGSVTRLQNLYAVTSARYRA